MKYVELKKFTEENGVCPVYVFEGEECYFLEGGEKLLLSQFRLDKLLDYASFDGATLKGDKIRSLVSAVECFPFMSEKRVVKVTEFYPTEKEFEEYLAPLISSPPTSSVLMIFNTGKSKKESVKFSQKKGVTYVDCGRSDEETIKRWIFLTAKRAGVYADAIVCGKIASFCVLDMSRVSKEVEKLLSYATAKGLTEIDDALVEALVYPDVEYKLYELSGALARKNYSAFITILDELKAKGYDELSLLSTLCYHFKSVYECAVVRGTDKEAAQTLGLKEYGVKKNREQAQRIGRDALKGHYLALYDAVANVKSGVYTPPSALKTAVARLFFGAGERN